jgi:hypothetical protein
MFGSFINSAKTKVQKLGLRKALELKNGREQFNELMRNNSPSIYLVDPELIADVVINAIITKDKEYVKEIYSEQGVLSAENKEYIGEFKNTAENIKNSRSKLIAEITNQLYQDFNKITLEDFNKIIEPIYNKLLIDLAKASENRRSYISFQYAAAKAGAELRRELNKVKISIFKDADVFITNLNNRIPFISYSFTVGVGNINKSIQIAVNKVLEAYLGTTETFKVGNLIHAGHVGIYKDNNLLGINTPGSLTAGLISKKFVEIEKAIGGIPLHLEHGIRLSTDYSQKAGMYLDMQFNFAISMEGTLNSAILGPQESAAIKQIIDNIATQSIEEAIKEQLSAGIIDKISEDTIIVGASPTFVEYYEEAIAAVYMGKNYSKLKHTARAKDSKYIGTIPVVASKVIKLQKISAPKTKISVAKQKALQIPSLTSLQNLINGNLYEAIKRNMGKGERRDVLNFRTGRFARSAEVTRLTMSREGMITAFYNYMKNPYATFSDGGRQQYPRSRDPKLLISKSIREIAAKEVANRLRAVVV